MAIDVGTARVLITGDYSKLAADFAAAQGLGASAGASIASAFSAGAAGADEMSGAAAGAAASEEEFAASTETANAALGHQVTMVQATGGALRTFFGEQSIRAAERFLALIPGLGVALQALFPLIGALALVETLDRFIGKNDKLIQKQDEVDQAIKKTDEGFDKLQSTIESVNVDRLTEQFGRAKGLQLKAFYSNDDANTDLDHVRALQFQIAELVRESSRFHFSLFGKGVAGSLGSDEMAADFAEIKRLQEEQFQTMQSAEIKQRQTTKDREDAARAGQEELGRLQAAQVSAQESQITHLAEMQTAVADASIARSHSVAEAQIAAIHDPQAAREAAAEEQLRVAQATEAAQTAIITSETEKRIAQIRREGAAQSLGKSQPEREVIGVNTGKSVETAEADAARNIIALHKETAAASSAVDIARIDGAKADAKQYQDAWVGALGEISKAYDTVNREQGQAVDKQIVAITRVAEVQAKGAGDVAALKRERQKIALEGQYAAMVGHTREQEVAEIQEVAALDQQARNQKIAGLQAEMGLAKSIDDEVQQKLKVAEIQSQINVLVAQGANAQTKANAQVAAANTKGSLGQQIGNIGQSGVASISNAVATGVMNGGKGLGKDIRQSLAGIGREMLGTVIKEGVEELVIAVTGNTIATNLNTIVTAVKALFGFAEGGTPPVGVPSIVGERGPEIFVPHQSGSIIPNHMIKGYADGAGPMANNHFSSSRSATFTGDMHFHGVQNVRSMMRSISDYSKSSDPNHSPFSS